jgi:hypothetical protein
LNVSFLKRVVGLAALAVGLAGVAFSVWTGMEIWETAGRLREDIPTTVGQLEGIVHSIHEQSEASADLLLSAREQVTSVGQSVERLTASDESKAAAASLLDRLNADIARQLDAAGEFVVSLQGSMRGLGSALALVDALPFFAKRADADVGQASQLRTVAGSLNETAELLEQVRITLARLRDGQGVQPEQLARLHDTLARVDGEIALAEQEVRHFSGRVAWTGEALNRWRLAAPRQINTISTAATVFLVCFGASQISLLLHGWSWLTHRRAVTGSLRENASSKT